MRHVTLGQFLSPRQVQTASKLWRELKDTGQLAAELERRVTRPNIETINRKLQAIREGLARDSRSLAHAIETAAVTGDCDELAGNTCVIHVLELEPTGDYIDHENGVVFKGPFSQWQAAAVELSRFLGRQAASDAFDELYGPKKKTDECDL